MCVYNHIGQKKGERELLPKNICIYSESMYEQTRFLNKPLSLSTYKAVYAYRTNGTHGCVCCVCGAFMCCRLSCVKQNQDFSDNSLCLVYKNYIWMIYKRSNLDPFFFVLPLSRQIGTCITC